VNTLGLPHRAAILVTLVAVLLGVAAAWRWTPLGQWLSVERIVDAGATLKAMPAAPLVVIGGYVIAGFLVVPLTPLLIATILVFGPFPGLVYALAGASLSALATYAVGHALGRDVLRRLAGARVNQVSRRLARRGVLTVALVRVMPIAPFTVVNVVAGASHIGMRDFFFGTLLGLVPGLTAITLFVHGVATAFANPSTGAILLLAGIVAAVAVVAIVIRRALRDRDAEGDRDA
jgi:phospholipase D1/2